MFFFSSRRRHTRFDCDWSSDVCSSDLYAVDDEQSNIRWARSLEESGAHVIYGIRGYKVHAKCCLVVRRGRHGIERYVHLGTGNYNDRTARGYTDFGLMTADRGIGEDASAFFNSLTG